MRIELNERDLGYFRKNTGLKQHCSWKIGGTCDLLIEPGNARQIQNAIQYVRAKKMKYAVIGGGAKLLFDDEGIRGALIRFGRNFSSLNIDGVSVLAEAGIRSANLTHALENEGLAGFEFLEGIPGTLGGMVFMNAGCSGYTIGERVRQVWALDEKGQVIRLSHDECEFGYRRSVFHERLLVILHVELECKRSDPEKIRERARQALKLRANKFPLEFPSCGSVFAALPRHLEHLGPPGKLIEDAGLKGLRIGDAEVSEKHANFIVNRGEATSADVIALTRKVRDAVREKTGASLECEARYVSPDAKICRLHEIL
ncbi:MAG: UDP-N-acetylmuramate dehydrogenase [Kiritimatiellia bacterium]